MEEEEEEEEKEKEEKEVNTTLHVYSSDTLACR